MNLTVKSAQFSEKFLLGDALSAPVGDTYGLFYSRSMIVNEKYLIGSLRFIKEPQGDRRLERTLIPQHRAVPTEICGQYTQLNTLENICRYELNNTSISVQAIPIDSIIYHFSGKNTFNYNARAYRYARTLTELFPHAEFSEIGSTNTGLNVKKSDIDICILSDYDSVTKKLRSPDHLQLCGFEINQDTYSEEIRKYCVEYGVSETIARERYGDKLVSLEFNGTPINFFDARNNPAELLSLNVNCEELINISGVVVDDTFRGHRTASYGILSSNSKNCTLILLREMYGKQKRHILKVDDLVLTHGVLAHKNPDVLLVKDLEIILSK